MKVSCKLAVLIIPQGESKSNTVRPLVIFQQCMQIIWRNLRDC